MLLTFKKARMLGTRSGVNGMGLLARPELHSIDVDIQDSFLFERVFIQDDALFRNCHRAAEVCEVRVPICQLVNEEEIHPRCSRSFDIVITFLGIPLLRCGDF